MDNRRLFLAILLSLGIMVGWQYFFPAEPPRSKAVPSSTREADLAEMAPAAEEEAAGPAAPQGAPPGAPGAPEAPAEAVAAAREERVVLESAGVRAELSNRGAQLVSMILVGHPSAAGKDLELIRPRQDFPYPLGLANARMENHPLNRALYAVERGGPQEVTFRYSGPEGVARKRIWFDEAGFLRAEVGVQRAKGWRLVWGPGLRNLSPKDLDDQYLKRRAVLYAGKKAEFLDPKKADPQAIPGGTSWLALEDNYYLAALVPDAGFRRGLLQPVLIQPQPDGQARFIPVLKDAELTDEQKDLAWDYAVFLEPEGESFSLSSYWGAKEYNLLKALPYDLEKAVDFGYFGILARPLLAGLHWIHDHMVPNYGWAIVLMTVAIKLLLLPLTHSSYMSMQKMQKLSPKMQAIRDKYRGKMRDKQGRPNIETQRKMNEELMGLYKSEGVNPTGGCLPMLLQLPILFAFYNMLTVAVELRNAPWILWIHDLSTRDPYYVLPIVMTAAQFIQMKLTPMTGDPAQRRIFQLMPIFMLIFFLPSPSGLVLYWLTNNVLSIGQQMVYNELKRRQEA